MKTLNDYVELIETIARIEYNRLSTSSHLIDFSELVNIGAIAVHVLITSNKDKEYNISYMSTAIKWAIRNELRRRYKWYAMKSTAKDDNDALIDATEENLDIEKSKIRESVYEQILSIEDMEEADNPTQIKDSSLNPEESLELRELNKAIKEAMKFLLPREKMVIESRFFKGRRIKDLAEEMNISSSRVSRIIQSGLDKIRNELKKKDMYLD
ncbi:MAG: sigma-70 family RNA polymerase sigma factor [bacterium]